MKFKTSFHSFSYQGQREYQQDRRYPVADSSHDEHQHIFAVCDGMGGTEQGDVASTSVANTLARMHDALNGEFLLTPDALSASLWQAYEQLDTDGKDIDTGTTLAMLWLHQGGCAMVNMGDSRVYQFRKSKGIVYRSKDHSLVNDLVEAHAITPEEALTHPRRNIITRCMEPSTLNRKRDNASAFFTADVRVGDCFLICSDGVVGEVSEKSLTDIILSDEQLDNKLATIAAFCENADDNATAILIEVETVTTEDSDEQRDNLKVEIEPKKPVTRQIESVAERGETSNFLIRLFNKIFK
ncbi:MAG: serine/threonine-protein phosphatase [Bacteroidaceae bacterium]|nr:serine/threonine-protein phosphatase [Bacteroidaceae bacterium]